MLGERSTLPSSDFVHNFGQEWSLLWFFAQNRGLALTRRQLLDGGWGSDWIGDIRTVDVHVRQLRRKLGDALPVKTVRGIGYRFD